MVTWGIWWVGVCVCVCVCVYEGFLIWTIPLTYQSHKFIIWACTTSFVHTCIYRMLDVSSRVYVYLCSRHHFLCMFFDSDLSIHMYLLDFRFSTDSLISIYVTGLCLYMYAWTTSLDHVHVWLPEHANLLHLAYSLVCFCDNPRSSCPDLRVWTMVAFR